MSGKGIAAGARENKMLVVSVTGVLEGGGSLMTERRWL